MYRGLKRALMLMLKNIIIFKKIRFKNLSVKIILKSGVKEFSFVENLQKFVPNQTV